MTDCQTTELYNTRNQMKPILIPSLTLSVELLNLPITVTGKFDVSQETQTYRHSAVMAYISLLSY